MNFFFLFFFFFLIFIYVRGGACIPAFPRSLFNGGSRLLLVDFQRGRFHGLCARSVSNFLVCARPC